MTAWWQSLTITEQFFAIVAVPSTIILLIQTVMLIFGLGGHDASADSDISGLDGTIGTDSGADAPFDMHDAGAEFHTGIPFDIHTDGIMEDTHGDYGHDAQEANDGPADHGLRLFTIRGFIAFFTIFGWTGLACLQSDMGKPAVFGIAVSAGILSMVIMALILKTSMKLAVNGTINLANAVGKTANVYLRIPCGRSGRGKVNVLVQGQYIEADAVTDEEYDLSSGSEVIVVGLTSPATLLVTARK